MKRNIVIATVAAAALIAGGTATALAVTGEDDQDAQRQTDTRTTDTRTTDHAVRAATAEVTAPEAIATALKHTAGTVVSAELDDEDAGEPTVWEVEILSSAGTWHHLDLDPGNGKILDTRTENADEDDTAEARAALKNTPGTAAEAAEATAAKGTVTSVDLDDKGWETETRSPGEPARDWQVNPTTGKITPGTDDD
ncbi:PepSY domain-containing protein [Streptomyces ziwulingensis]|uniref:PepSY domain-containing protein n=1 Tax=Streptomyces ziwulingensis TaxID=1045501 RepID=A0ABP9B937_9ACTN